MAAGAILYVGDDICHRIPVIETAGIVVLRSECSVGAARSFLAKGDLFSAVTFHNDVFAPADAVVRTARELSRVPLILFKNPAIDCEEWPFDLVFSVPTPPEVWSKSLGQAIEEARKLHDYSQQLREDYGAVRDMSRSLFELAVRNRETDLAVEDPDDVKS